MEKKDKNEAKIKEKTVRFASDLRDIFFLFFFYSSLFICFFFMYLRMSDLLG